MKSQKLSLKKIVLAAMFAALACVATMVINIPIPATGGYINLGDCIVILAGWMLGGAYGAAAGGIGSMLADLIPGYASFAPGTLVIKALMAFVAYVAYKSLAGINGFVARLLSAILLIRSNRSRLRNRRTWRDSRQPHSGSRRHCHFGRCDGACQE